jgi:acetolactate synthase-1/2/3 large subunit
VESDQESVKTESNKDELFSGGELLMKALIDEGVDVVFGYPGGAILHIYDALHQEPKIRHVLVRHEQAATHMADGFARACGKPGVVFATSGPGATNTITGVATAYMDSIPMVVITGNVPSHLIGEDAFQETDIIGVSRPIVKHSYLVKSVSEIPRVVKQAFYLATTGRPGPVVVDIPKDMTDPNARVPLEKTGPVNMRSYNPVQRGHLGQIKKAVKALQEGKRPIIYSGGGVIQGEGSALLTEFARLAQFPITSTLMGLGAFPSTDRQFLGMLGMHGTYEANMAMHHSDVILCIGARLDDRVTNNTEKFCPGATLIHVDVDPASISKTVKADIPIVGPAHRVLQEMIDLLKKADYTPKRKSLADWWERIDGWRARDCLAIPDRDDEVILPQLVVRKVYEATKGEAIVTSDVGQHQMFAALYYPFDWPRQWINSGGLGTMGFGLPAAMGVLYAEPEKTVVCITGEGSIQMNIQELSTCLQYGLPVKIIILNNLALGMVKQWQDLHYNGRYAASSYEDSLPDFVRLAEAYGHLGRQIMKKSELEEGLAWCFAQKDRLVVLDIRVDPDEHVYPMHIKSGSMRDMFLSKTERT